MLNFKVVSFFEKPGCATNAKQKRLLNDAGIMLHEVDLLKHPFNKHELYEFFKELEVPQWFNPNAPKIKEGVIVPDQLTPEAALALMVAEPILIKRPLLILQGVKVVGFDEAMIEKHLGIRFAPSNEDRQSCSHEG